MTKIVYNACYGGFGLSDAAMELYLTRKGINYTSKPSSYKTAGSQYYVAGEYFCASEISRADPVLAAVVEDLGPQANGSYSNLKIEEVPEGTLYRIDEYDGYESVMTITDYQWEQA